MKRVIYITIAALSLTSCLKKPAKTTTEQTSTPSAQAEAVDFKAPEYLSADLAMQDLGGKVKSMEYTAYACDEKGEIAPNEDGNDQSLFFNFDTDGNMTKGFAFDQDDKGPKFFRNDKGQIEHTERMLPNLDFTYVNSFVYNERGNIISEEIKGYEFSGTTTNSYTDGVLTSATAVEAGEGTVYRTTSSFTVIEVDAQGNWTKRLCKSEIESGPDDGSGKYDGHETSYGIEVRKILYY